MKYSKSYSTCGQPLMRIVQEAGRSVLSLIYKLFLKTNPTYGFHPSNDDPSGKVFHPMHVRWSIPVVHQSRKDEKPEVPVAKMPEKSYTNFRCWYTSRLHSADVQ